MNLGPNTSEPDSHAILSRAVDAGINFIDTADQYGGHLGVGTTESIIGRWLAEDGDRRESTVLATKVHEPMSPAPNDSGLSARHIIRGCEASLRRLQTDHIDLYQMHHIDRSAPWDEIWQAMETLVSQGKVLYIGSSNFPGWSIARANEAASNRHFLGLVSEQSLYNLTQRSIELEVLPACEAYGLGVLPWSPLARGLLGGVLSSDQRGGRRAADDLQQTVARLRPQIEDWERLCADIGREPSQVALAWLLHQPIVTAPVIGPRTVTQLESTLEVVGLELEPDVLARLDEIFPGPGPAPEAYAW